MAKKSSLGWKSLAAVGAAATSALVLAAKPRDPTFHLTSITLTSLRLNFPLLDAELMITVHVTNPNVAPIQYSSTTMGIWYEGSLLGSARVEAGSQGARSCQILRLPARLDGLELAHHAARFLADVARREMVLHAAVDLQGAARLLWWDHRFKVSVHSHITVDPLFLDVIHQENKSHLDLLLT